MLLWLPIVLPYFQEKINLLDLDITLEDYIPKFLIVVAIWYGYGFILLCLGCSSLKNAKKARNTTAEKMLAKVKKFFVIFAVLFLWKAWLEFMFWYEISGKLQEKSHLFPKVFSNFEEIHL